MLVQKLLTNLDYINYFYTLMPVSPRAIWNASIKFFLPKFKLFFSTAATIFSKSPVSVSNLLHKTTGIKGWFGTLKTFSEKIIVTRQPLAAKAVNVSIKSFVGEFIMCNPFELFSFSSEVMYFPCSFFDFGPWHFKTYIFCFGPWGLQRPERNLIMGN